MEPPVSCELSVELASEQAAKERDRQSRTCSLARNLLGTLRRENIWMKKLISAGLIAGLALSLLPAA
ncbi:MAG TPA: hypothetical protein VGN26_06690, partial [Armatimonadota bacterium]